MSESTPVVLHLISSLGIGGAERLLVDTLTATRGDPSIAYTVAIMNETVNAGFFAELEATGAPVYRLDRKQGHLHPKYLTALLRIIDTHGVDIIHTHNEGSRTWGMIAKVMRPKLKLVYTVHSHDNAESITGLRRRAYTALVDSTVAISAFVAKTAKVLKPRNLELVPNGISLARFSTIVPRDSSDGWLRLTNVARFIPFKGQDVLIEALAICRDRGVRVRCTCVGTIADQAFFASLRGMVEDRKLGDIVEFAVDRSDIETFFVQSDAFVLSSRDEGFGIAIVEAMAAGLPVIVPKVGGAADIVVDGTSGLQFIAGDPLDLAEKIIKIEYDATLRQRLAAGGRERARTYDIRTMAARLCALYQRLLAPKT